MAARQRSLVLLLLLAPAASGLRVTSGVHLKRREVLAAAANAALLPLAAGANAEENNNNERPTSIVTTILEAGDTSSPLPQRAQTAVVDYTLWIDGFERKQIDSSLGAAFPPKLPSPFKFQVGVGQVIPGWDRTVRQMHVGEKRRVVIPAELGYGAKVCARPVGSPVSLCLCLFRLPLPLLYLLLRSHLHPPPHLYTHRASVQSREAPTFISRSLYSS